MADLTAVIMTVLGAVIAVLVFLFVLILIGVIPKWKPTKQDKELLLALLASVGIILFWRGIWHTADTLPIISNPVVSLFVGLLIVTISGFLYRVFGK